MVKKKTSILVKLMFVVFSLYAVISLIVLQARINQQEQLSLTLQAQLADQTVLHSSLAADTGSELDEEALIAMAREQGYCFPGEFILVDTAK